MAENSKIEWTDHTFNPWIGCTKVSPGCANCYAENATPTRVARKNGKELWGKGQARQRTSAANWKLPVKWNKVAAEKCCGFCDYDEAEGELISKCKQCAAYRPRVFCASLSDWLDDEVPIEWLADLLRLIHDTPNLDWLLLTKRPENWRERLMKAVRSRSFSMDAGDTTLNWRILNWIGGTPPQNVWIGTTVEDQVRADERIPELLKIPAKVRFLSCEPLLGPVDLTFGLPWKPEHAAKSVTSPVLKSALMRHTALPGVDWVICGGESGPGARPMHPDWARSLRDQCQAAGVPFFFKQWGEWEPYVLRAGGDLGGAVLKGKVKIVHPTGESPEALFERTGISTVEGSRYMEKVGKKAAGRLLDGVEWNEVPV